MKTIVISNRKGGSAKTTTTVNLAASLAKIGNVLVIDFDTQGHAGIGLGHQPVEEGGVHSIFEGHNLSFTFVPTQYTNITLAPASAFFDVYSHHSDDNILKQRLKDEKIDQFFDFCIIDTPPTYDTLLKNSLAVANAVIIPVVPHYLGTVGVDQMVRAIYQMALKTHNSIEHIGILPVMYNEHIPEHKNAIEQLQKSFGKEKFFSPIRIDIAVATSFSEQTPIVLKDGRTRGAKDYKKFCSELQSRLLNDTRNH